MRQRKSIPVILILALLACSLSAPASPTPALEAMTITPPPATAAATETPAATPTASMAVVTETLAPSATATPEPSPSPALLDLEIVEWAVYPYANLADPENTDVHVEILVRNPNEIPVQVIRDGVALRFLNATGETVYTNPNPVFYIWTGSWMLGGEIVALSACVCFDTDGVEKRDWVSLELVAPLEPAAGMAYATDVEVILGEFFFLSEIHQGGDSLAAELEPVNTGDQVLQSIEVRVIARDADGVYVGVAIHGEFAKHDASGNYVPIEPGNSSTGLVVTLIDDYEGPLVYEIAAIGILLE